MAKRLIKKPLARFWVGAGIYAGVFLTVLAIGLACLWNFLGAYELSRPQTAADAYLAGLAPNYICDWAEASLLEQVDSRLQSPDQVRALVLESLQGEFSCAKNLSRSTEETLVYALRQGSRVIGSFRMEPTGKASWGFRQWEITGEEFDLSCLLSDPVSVTVPEGCTVRVDGVPLSAQFVAETDLPYPELAGFSGEYPLPTLTRYETGPLAGPARVTVTDPGGAPIDPDAGAAVLLDNCTPEEKEALTRAVGDFMTAYVDYTSCNGGYLAGSLAKLNTYMVPGSELATRMRNAIDGLYWVTDRHASIAELEIPLFTRLDDGLYLCSVICTVDTTDMNGQVRAVNRSTLIFRASGNTLLAEAMVTE